VIDLLQAATPRREARVQGTETSTEDVVIVREPPRPADTGKAAGGAGRGAPPWRAASGFFRDPDAVRALGGLVPALFAGKGPDDVVRVWVAGCAAGEEAWSVAILLAEHAATLPHPPTCELFATDTDAAACVRGRNALYPAWAVAGVPAARLGRFFVWEGGGYRVARPLRAAVLFATHDVLHDPPFERLDLVSCRGLLSVLPADEQARVVATFHQALRPGGVLFLAAGESAGGGFVPAAEGHGIHHRDDAPAGLPAQSLTSTGTGSPP
jgi:two-component system CheB/CheR fusion protein